MIQDSARYYSGLYIYVCTIPDYSELFLDVHIYIYLFYQGPNDDNRAPFLYTHALGVPQCCT